ncbi:hypothetical protein BASA60_009899 [Batrachochytrium salamandrivorans]|nr:hypothetical protein BASA60_009899 [Batrachochytrium salamandrivorans]
MYDLRGNSGGNADFASNMVQLFKPDFKPFGDRYLMNKITQNIFFDNKNPNANPFAKAWQETEPNSRFTNVLFPNSVKSANTLGQAYLRPMGILNDAKCYSACEVFSGGIQGHGAGTIFGEDKQTGGGGADCCEIGSLAHPCFLYTLQNSFHSARSSPGNGQSKLHFVCEPFETETSIGKFSLEVESAGIDVFTVLQDDGETIIAKQRRSRATNKQKFSISVSAAGSTLGNNRITIVGKTAGVQVLKTKRNVRTIPTNDKYMKISTHGFTFTGTSDSVGLYQSPTTAPADGWNNLRGPWMIGDGVQYVGGIDSSLEAFFTAPIGTRIDIDIDVTLDTEPGCDFLYLSVKSSDGVEIPLIRSNSRDGTKTFSGVSGRNMIVRGTVSFTTKSETFSVSLRFTSDEATAFAGATINSLTVSAA